jgi:S1-C subfamily serine protease
MRIPMRIHKRFAAWSNDFTNRAVLSATGVALLLILVAITHPSSIVPKQAPHFSTRNPSSSAATPLLASTEGSRGIATDTQASAATSTITSRLASKKTAHSPTEPKPILTPLTPSPQAVAARELNSSGSKLLRSLVNIVCVSNDPSIPSISGSGVLIDSRGIILTAAHVAQLFLLQDYLGTSKVQCLVRAGSPARRAYLAEPIYVSPSWIIQNPATLSASSPEGTGENDFALLAITATATSTPLSNTFQAMALSSADPTPQETVTVGSYGAQYLSPSELNYSLYPLLVFGSIKTRFTYAKDTVDLVSIEGSAASQEGSSGGGIANGNGELIGTITTSSIAGSIGTRSLNAITINHMRRSFNRDMGQNLDTYIQSHGLSTLISGFASESQKLGELLARNL